MGREAFGLVLWEQWYDYEDEIYYSDEFNTYMEEKMEKREGRGSLFGLLFGGGMSRHDLLSFVWLTLYPYSQHESPPTEFCEDYISEQLEYLEEQWQDEYWEDMFDFWD